MKFENNSNQQFQPHGNIAIFEVPLDDNILDAISAGARDAGKVLHYSYGLYIYSLFKR